MNRYLIATTMRIAAILAVLSLTSACSTTADSPPPAAARQDAESTAASRGLAFAQTNCAACHAVETGTSPRPEAPPFASVVNTPGLTANTLRPWLQDSHNFPEMMNFAIAPEQIDDLAAYLMTLKDPTYRPPIQ